jgi:hypothetical protein
MTITGTLTGFMPGDRHSLHLLRAVSLDARANWYGFPTADGTDIPCSKHIIGDLGSFLANEEGMATIKIDVPRASIGQTLGRVISLAPDFDTKDCN